ncbi:MAG TPA: hypothetical protein VD997_08665 [Phycisphaerales bacterium]|nr:hypothetical protein [Phycisphaerales bacterium]
MRTRRLVSELAVSVLASVALASAALATPEFVTHIATQGVNGGPAGTTMREPDAPRDGETVELWAAVGYSFYYTDVAVYYTTDGSAPQGSRGVALSGATQVLRSSASQVTFSHNEGTPGGQVDWWRGTLPGGTRAYGQRVRYTVGAWHSGGGPEVFSNNTGCSDGRCDNPAGTPTIAEFTNKIAWPGAGAGNANPSAGYPPVSFWKEEAIIGNTYCAAQIDQNGTYYDFHFPTPGGVQGVGTQNEGYVDGQDTFPPMLPSGWRGQMHLNQAMPGIRVDGTTYWMSNQQGLGYSGVTQDYVTTSNTVITTQTLSAGGNNISVVQSDFSPLFGAGGGVQFPVDAAGRAQRHILIKRMTLTNHGPSSKTVQVYFYMDPALNGGDGYDAMFWDAARGAMTAFDKTFRVVTGTGVGFAPPNEYNPTTFAGYEKSNALYLSAAMKVTAPGAGGGTLASEAWRDTSSDQFQGWIGQQVLLPPGTPVEVDIILAGAHQRPIPAADAIYNEQLVPVLDWFASSSMGAVQAATDSYWSSWLNAGVTIDTPDQRYDDIFKRSLLATALHCDTVNGGVIAGFHNGAYPYVWPRDAVYAAITLARTGHLTEAANVYRWMREVCYRDWEAWGRLGFWKQKYSTDGYVIWGAPQIDETAAFPWGVWYQYLMTGDSAFLNLNYSAVRDAVLSMSQDSSDSRLYFDDFANLMYSNNVWEDSYDVFLYSNASVYRGLDDARAIASAVGNAADATDAFNRRNAIKNGLDARLAWDGENTDVSHLGLSYPFDVYPANDGRLAHLVDRMNGVATDRFGNNHPLVNFGGEHAGTINRYWGDSYWRGGPWFLSTLWYGLYYAQRQDFTPGTGDIDNHKLRLDLCLDRLGPTGLGAEQIAYSSGPLESLLYPGQSDFVLQTAWPNAWESMSTMADAMMAFLDFRPDAPANAMVLNPKLPSAWTTMTFRGVTLVRTSANQTHKVDVTVTAEAGGRTRNEFNNRSGFPLTVYTSLRSDPGQCVNVVTVNGVGMTFSRDAVTGRIALGVPLATGANAMTVVAFEYSPCCGTQDYNGDGDFGTDADIEAFFACLGGHCCDTCCTCGSDFNADGDYGTDADIESFFRVLGGGPC